MNTKVFWFLLGSVAATVSTAAWADDANPPVEKCDHKLGVLAVA